jgi:hypothetical protein
MLSFLFRGARRRAARKSHTAVRQPYVPRLDVLEDRTLPSTFTVTNLSDSGTGSLRSQLAAAAPGDIIDFAPQLQGAITLGSTLTLDRGVTVVGNLDPAGNPLVTLSCGGADGSTDLLVAAGVTASVEGLSFTGATLHALVNQGSLTLDHVTISGNHIGYYASGAYGQSFFGTVYNTGALTVEDSTISDNRVNGLAGWTGPNGGAGIWSTGTLTVLHTQLVNDVAEGGNTNLGYTYGGAICNYYGGTATVIACTLTGNQASEGGGLCSVNSGTLTVSGCAVSGNSAASGGGGLSVLSGTAQVTGCTITNNTAITTGGGMDCSRSTLTLSGSTLAGNRVGGSGNTGEGGGLWVRFVTATTVTIANCTIANNSAVGYVYQGQPHPGAGGGLYVFPLPGLGGVLTVVGSTVAGNGTDGSGGGLWVGARTPMTLTNTLVAGNTAVTGGADVFGPLLPTSAFNLIGNGDGSTGLVNGALGNQVGTTAAPIDPRLGPLEDNGGPTPTMALLSGSPAIDAGSNTNPSAFDQRGTGSARVVGAGIDVGAFEAPAATLQPGVMTHFGLTTVASPVAGTPFVVTVQALDDSDNAVPGYVGPIHFTITDGSAVLSQDYTLTAADAGAHAFGVTLTTAGTQVLTVTADAPAGPLTERGAVTVSPGAAASLRLSAPTVTTAGQLLSVTATLLDAYGNVATGYTGTVHFTSSDAKAALPADYTFSSADAGTHAFRVILKTAGSQSISATDTRTSSLAATSAGITVNPAAAAKFVLTAPTSVKRGVAFSLTLTVQDTFGNIVTGYTGTVHFTSSDGTATLPANYTFTAADAGVHTFASSTILRKKGTQTLTVTDLANGALMATDSINVL